ncbi:hypothetical protein CN446_15040 [Bacillus cereus]|nr:hypothetical protein CN446_15040 [Bacillus cereus]
MRCAIYRRVSTDEQVEKGYSLENQKIRLESFATSQGWEVVGDYVDDGYSGKDTNRPAFKKMFKDVEKFDVILVYKLDRFTRSVKDLNEMLETIREHDIAFKSATESIDTTTATGRMILNMMGSTAQWERETISERIKDVIDKQREQGIWNGGITPYGYRKTDGILSVQEDEAETVRFIFKNVIAYGYIKISKLLNEKGIPTAKGKGLWIAQSVRNIVKNHYYYGKMNYCNNGREEFAEIKIEGYKPIISKDEFNLAQKATKKRASTPTRSRSDEIYPFSGIAVCPQCGAKLGGTIVKVRGSKYKYYRCSKRNQNRCNSPAFRDTSLDEAFLKYLKMPYPDLKVKRVDNLNSSDVIKKEIKKLNSKKDKVKELYIEEFLTKKEFKDKIFTIDNKILELESELENNNQAISDDLYRETLLFMEQTWNGLDDETKAFSLRGLFDSLVFKKTGRSKVEFIDHTLL